MKKLFLTAAISAVLTTQAQALDIDWVTFKTNHFNTVTSAAADAFAAKFLDVVKTQGLAGKVVAIQDAPLFPQGNSSILSFGLTPKYSSTDCVTNWTALTYNCTITGYAVKMGGVPSELSQATDVMWWSDFITALGTDGATMSPFVTALFSSFTSANSDGKDGKVYFGSVGYFKMSSTTGSLSFTGTSTDFVATP